MPRSSDFDFDFDSPPPSPKHGRHLHPRSVIQVVVRHLRRSRSLLILLCILIGIAYSIFWPHRPWFPPTHAPSLRYKNINWSRYAYSQYATDSHYLCNSIMLFEALERLGSKAERILMYPEEWDIDIASKSDRDSQLLVMARDWYRVKMLPVQILRFQREGSSEKGEGEQIAFASWFKMF